GLQRHRSPDAQDFDEQPPAQSHAAERHPDGGPSRGDVPGKDRARRGKRYDRRNAGTCPGLSPNTPLTIGQELGILGIGMINPKGASGVTGAGFVTLAATLAIVPDIPIQSLAILLGIDKFMSECRALTNLIGNGVATIVISRWEGELDAQKLHEAMAHPIA